jgi:AraC-like DNA-binding protein
MYKLPLYNKAMRYSFQLQNPKFRLVVYILLISISLILYLISAIPSDFYKPGVSSKKTIWSFDDGVFGGSSFTTMTFTPDGIKARFDIGGKYVYPYTGISFKIRSKKNVNENLKIKITLDCPKETSVLLFLTQQYKIPQGGGKIESKQLAEYLLKCKKGKHEYAVPVSEFKSPLWWLRDQQLTSAALNWGSLNTFTVQNNPIFQPGDFQELTINEIKFCSPWNVLLYIGVVVLVIACAIEIYLKRNKTEIAIKYVPIDTEQFESTDDSWQRIADYIGKYYKEEISLETIAAEIGINKQKITNLIKENSTFNLRQYINAIRINEAENLMKETNLGITEIGYEVGYSSATHFNRVFKEIRGVSPSEFRKKIGEEMVNRDW